MDLTEARMLMHQRDHAAGRPPHEREKIHMGLADEVPGLVAEVERFRDEMVDLTSKLNTALEEKERWRLRAEAAERALEGSA